MKVIKVSVIIPHLGGEEREKGLKRCIDSLYSETTSNYILEIKVIDGPETVPQKVKKGVEETDGEYIVYAANDLEFAPNAIWYALLDSVKNDKMHIAFNDGPVLPDEGNINCHFLIKRELLSQLEDGEVFSTRYFHCGTDNFLYAQTKKLGQFMRSESAKVKHYHFSNGWAEMDEVYSKGWSHAEEDRARLKEDLKRLESL